jgi:hypothetical protein
MKAAAKKCQFCGVAPCQSECAKVYWLGYFMALHELHEVLKESGNPSVPAVLEVIAMKIKSIAANIEGEPATPVLKLGKAKNGGAQ